MRFYTVIVETIMADKVKISIVEDDSSIRDLYKFKLEAEGYQVSTANDGAAALHVLEVEQPALILLDIRLPHLPGHEVLRRVRATEWGKDMRVIVLTNISKDEAPAAFRFLDVSYYAVKAHYTPSQIVEIIKQALARR